MRFGGNKDKTSIMKRFLMRSFMIFFSILFIWILVAPGCMTFRKADSVMKKEFRQKGVMLFTATEKIDGRNMHYAKTGSDSLPTIYFIHGTPGSWDAFAGYLSDTDLLQHYRLISIDRPGFGYSDYGKAVDLRRQSELISPLFYKLANGKPAYLAGHSLGGPMIVKLAADNPNFFQGLVMLAGSVDPAEEKPEKWRPWLFNTPLNWLVPGAMRPSNEELWYLKKDLVYLKEDFKKIVCPVFILHGDKDVLVPVGNVEYAKKMLSNASHIAVTIFHDENHFIPWTRFREIKTVLMQLGQPISGPRFTMSNQ
jgi:pimeloyl-ACP methyl ester carboxylesterase